MELKASSSAESPGSVVSDAVASVSMEVDSEARVPSPVSEQEEFLSGEEESEPEFETASERPLVPEPDEAVEPDDLPRIQPAAAMEEENSKDAPSSAAYPESFPVKDEARIDETDGVDQKSSYPPAVDSKSLLSESNVRNEDEAVLDKIAEDGDEKNKSPEEIRTSGNLGEVRVENNKSEVSFHESSSEESGKDGALHDDPVLNGADDAPRDTAEIEHSETSKGNEEVIAPLVQDSDAVKVLPGTLELENSNPREDPEVTVQEDGDDHGTDSDDNTGVTLVNEQELQASEALEIPSHDSTKTREIALNLEKSESIDKVDAIEQALAELQTNSVNSKLGDTSPEDEQKFSAIEEHSRSGDSPNLESSEIAPVVEYSGMIEARVAEEEEDEEEEEEEDDDDNYDDDDAEMDVRRIMKELEQGSSNQMDGQIVSDSEEEIGTGEERQVKDFFDPETLTTLLKAAANASSDESITISAVDRPAGLGSSIPSLKPTPNRSIRSTLFPPSDMAQTIQEENPIDEEDKKLQDNVDQIRVKFLRLVNRLGHSPEDRVATQVLYRLGLAEGIKRGKQLNRGHSTLENSKKKAFLLEEQDKENLDFTCNILIIGKTGVGKSATINSIFGEEKVPTNAFESSTKSIRPILGTVDGIKLRVTDTPGLKPSVMDQMANKRILESIKRYTRRFPPDIVLYVDRLDTQTWDFNDLPLLRSVSSILGSSLWFNAIVGLTHSATAPPDGPTGTPLSYEGFIDQRSRIVQHAIRQAAGDMRLMNPVALVENHPLCRKNREGHRILPNGLSWRQQLLLLCYSSKILSEANSLLKLQEPSPAKLFGFRVRSPPLPYLLSSLLQSRAHPKMGSDGGDSDVDLGESSDSDLEEEEEEEYDQLPPFKPLRKAQLAKLTNEQRNAYYEEYDYRVKLLQKKQLKEMKKTKKAGQREDVQPDDFDQDGAPAAVPVPLPDMILPPSFDSDNPVHRFRFLEPTSQLLTRPVLDSHSWDHDCGYDGVSLEDSLSILNRFPAGFTLQLTKDKKEFNVHFDSSVSAKHGETGSTLAGFDVQSVGKQLAYILRGESKFRTFRNNKTTAGVALTLLGENVATGVKLEDQLLVGKRFGLVGSTGAVRAQGDMAYGANVEVRLRDKEFPISQDVSTLGLSLMRWRGDMALGANLQSQVSVGRGSKVAVRVGLNNKLSGQITIRTSTSDQLQIALLGVLPVATYIYRTLWAVESY